MTAATLASVDSKGLFQVVDTSRQMVTFSPAGAIAGVPTASLCIRNNGMLMLLGNTGSDLLWQPEYTLPQAGSGPFTVRLTNTGQLH